MKNQFCALIAIRQVFFLTGLTGFGQLRWHFEKLSKAAGVIVAADLQEALKKAAETNCNEIFVIGGGEIYKQSMEIADKIYMTRVHASFEADTFFPEIDENNWQLVTNQYFGVDEKHKYAYSFQTWNKK